MGPALAIVALDMCAWRRSALDLHAARVPLERLARVPRGDVPEQHRLGERTCVAEVRRRLWRRAATRRLRRRDLLEELEVVIARLDRRALVRANFSAGSRNGSAMCGSTSAPSVPIATEPVFGRRSPDERQHLVGRALLAVVPPEIDRVARRQRRTWIDVVHARLHRPVVLATAPVRAR